MFNIVDIQRASKNRKKFKKYLQIYINSNFDKLKKINFNKVYHLNKNVVGKDILFPKPYKSDFILDPTNKIEYKKIYKNYFKNKMKFFYKTLKRSL